MQNNIEQMKTMELRSNFLTVKLTNYGARLLSLEYKGTDCVYGPKDALSLAGDTCYCGSVCGRVANRIADGSFELDGKNYSLATNNGHNHLHGGNVGFSDRLWTVEHCSDTEVALSLFSPDGEEGYPGSVSVQAVYVLNGNKLTLKLRATTDTPTLLNLTNHVYWNLDGSGTIDNHRLQVCASAYTPMKANIPVGSIEPVKGSLYDLTSPAFLGERNAAGALEGGYDDNYVLPASPGLKKAAVLSNKTKRLNVFTDAPGLQVYTGDYLPRKRGGIALEAQHYPDSPHHAHFPTIELRPGDTYERVIAWSLDSIE